MKLYVITFMAYGAKKIDVSINAWTLKSKAEKEAKQLIACGHTDVEVHQVELSTK